MKYTYYYINTGGAKLPYDPLAALPGDVKTLTNQLAYVTDDINSNYTEDIDNQLAGNYDYDGIGNLIKDVKEGITSIAWNVYGKIKTITKTGTNISYTYDASGNRISKNVNGKETWYVRDATGNVLSVYTKDAALNNGNLTQTEIDLYGSSRLGILNRNNYVGLGSIVPGIGSHYYLSYTRGKKFFELSNHLGNVLTVVSDRKKPFAKTTNQNVVDFYVADIKSVRDYYPFGIEMPGRKFTSTSYRYGFNGKELDKEITSTTTYDYGFRIYSPGLGRFLSVDPLTKSYSMLTPYQYASNKPINSIDRDGEEVSEVIHWMAQVGTSRYAAKLSAPTLRTLVGIKDRQTQYIFGFSNGLVSAFDIKGLVQTYSNYQIEAMKSLFSSRINTFMQENVSFEEFAKVLPLVQMSRNAFYSLKSAIDKAYSGDAYAAGQVQAMCFTACIGGLSGGDLASLRSAGGRGIQASEILASKIKVSIPYGDGFAVQSSASAALDGMVQASKGKTLYRLGIKGESMSGDAAQFWSLENPLSMTPVAYAKKYGVDLERILKANQIETSNLKPGAKFITRQAANEDGTPIQGGGGIEVVTQEGGTINNVITPIRK